MFLTGCSTKKVEPPKAQQGVLDLTNWTFSDNGPVNLNGQWEFYYNQLLTPEDFKDNSQKPSGFIEVPSSWSTFKYDNQNIPGAGYATYRLLVNLNEESIMALKAETIWTSYKLWVNGSLISSAGTVGTSPSEMKPDYNKQVHSFTPDSRLEIVIQVSNYTFLNGGICEPIHFGLDSQLHQLDKSQIAQETLLIGGLLIISIYYLCFLMLRRDKGIIYFVFACILIIIRTLAMGDSFLEAFMPFISWDIYTKAVYTTVYMIAPCFVMYYNNVFPKEIPNWFKRVTQIVSLVLVALVPFVPYRTQSYLVRYHSYYLVVVISFILFGLILSVVRKREGSIISILGAAIFSFTALNDILAIWKLVGFDNLIPFGIVAIILSLSFVLASRLSNALTRSEIMTKDLSKLNSVKDGFLNKIKDISSDLDNNSNHLSKLSRDLYICSQKVSKSIDSVAAGSTHQVEALSDMSERVVDFSAFLDGILNSSSEVKSNSWKVSTTAQNSSKELMSLFSSINEIHTTFNHLNNRIINFSNNLEQIKEINNVINNISRQTNLLSLNASVEASKAGVHGQGFHVIASEIRKLADQTKKSSKEITSLISVISSDTENILNNTNIAADKLNKQSLLVDSSMKTFNEIIKSVEGILPQINSINDSILGLNEIKNTITERVETNLSISTDNSAIAEEIYASSENMNAFSENIAQSAKSLSDMTKELMNQFHEFESV